MYNGESAWNTLLDSGEAADIREGCDRRYDPSFRYQVLDLRRVQVPGGEWNVAVLQCKLQVRDMPDDLDEAARPLRKLLDSKSDDGLGPVFPVWISSVLLPAMGVEGVLASA